MPKAHLIYVVVFWRQSQQKPELCNQNMMREYYSIELYLDNV